MSGVARRSLLRGGIAAALLPLGVGAFASAAEAAVDVGSVTRAAFEVAAGARVQVVAPDRVAPATIVRVADLRHAPPGHEHAFAVTVRLDRGSPRLGSGLVDIELPGQRVTGIGLLAIESDGRVLVATIDRRTVAEHVTSLAH